MSEKIIIETLRGLGLTEKDVQVYIQLAKKGPILARDITKSFKINKAQVYRSLKNLQSKGIVQATIETPQNFTAMPFEKVFELHLKIKNEEIKKIEQTREAAMQQWQALDIKQAPQSPDRFMVLDGKNFIYTKLQEMIDKAEHEILVATNIASLAEADSDSMLEKFLKNKKISIKLISEISPANSDYVLELTKQFSKNASGKHIDLKERFFPRFVLTDNSELMFLTAGFENDGEGRVNAGLWTNNQSLIQSFRVLFNELWKDGVDFQEKIAQLKNGQEPQINQIIKDPKEALKLTTNIVNSAKKEIVIIATEPDLELAASRIGVFEDWRKRQLDIKILAPITKSNRKYAKALSKYVEIRHTNASYFRSMIVDQTHLIQLKTPSQPAAQNSIESIFAPTLYTNIPEFVRGRLNLLLDLWEHTPKEIGKLKLNEALYRSIYEKSLDAIILSTPSGEVVAANNAALGMFNMTIDEIKKANRQSSLALDQKAAEEFKRSQASSLSKLDLTYRRKDDSTFEGETTESSFTVDGKIKNCITTIRDVTQRKIREETLRQSQTRLYAMFDCLSLGVAIVEPDGRITFSNPAYQQIQGYSQEELNNKTLLEITHPEDRQKTKEHLQKLFDCKTSSVTFEKRNVRKDDSIIRVRVSLSVLSRDVEGNPTEYIATLEDVTAQPDDEETREIKKQLKASQERFQMILDNSPDIIYRLNLQTGHYEFASQSTKNILGYTPEEVANMSNEEVHATLHPDDLPQLQMDLIKLMQEGKGVAEYRIKRKDGTYIWYRNTMFLTYDERGRPLYRNGFGRDITESKQRQTTDRSAGKP